LPTRPSRAQATTKTPVRAALTGGIGAGKSEALEAFRRHGAATLSTDEVVHRLYAEDAELRAALEQRYGTIDRGAIAEVVFREPGELAWLEALIHPRVRAAYAAWLEEVEAPVAVVEIPLLYETGADAAFDKVVVVSASEDVRRARRGGQVDERAARLLDEDEKVRRADFAFVNDSTLEALDAFVQAVLERLQKDA
jgi:dephospho-CoA kinase